VCSETGGGGGGAVSDCDSQRSSASYEEGTYDGRQGSVTYSCRDDEEIMKSSDAATEAGDAAVMYDQRYQQQYVVFLSKLVSLNKNVVSAHP